MSNTLKSLPLKALEKRIIQCERCPRLTRYRKEIAQEKRKSFQNETYWGKPVPGFGDPQAKVVVVGLAPAAHGANRTGRIFTGDRSGEWLYRALYQAGFSNQEKSISRSDGLQLKSIYITCPVRCAPPDNHPTPKEFQNCAPFLHEELTLLKNTQVYIALGQIALRSLLQYLNECIFTQKGERLIQSKMKFAHGARFQLSHPSWAQTKTILCSYHPSQQNTFTGKLTQTMFQSIFDQAASLMRL